MHSYDQQRWAVLFSIVVALIFFGWVRRKRFLEVTSPLFRRPLVWLLLMFMFAFQATAVFPAVVFLELTWCLAFFGLMLLFRFLGAHLSPLGWKLLGTLGLLILIIYALVALDRINFHWPIFTKPDATPGFANIRHFSDIAVGLMPLALIYVMARHKHFFPVALLTAFPLGVWWYLLFLTEGRAGVLSLVMAMLVALVLFRRHAAWPVGTLFFSALPAAAAWWWLNPLRQPATSGEGGGVFTRDITVTYDRFRLWGEAWQHAIDHFPLGIGPMGFAGDGIDDGFWAYTHAHNLFLTTAAEWGIPLALMLLALVLYGCWKIAKRSQQMPEGDRPLYACLVMAFVGVMVNVQFSGAHIIPLSSLVMALAIGLVFGFRGVNPAPTVRSEPAVAATPPSTGLGPTLLWGAGMLMMAYLLFASWELYQLSVASTRLCFEELGRMWYFPRFWAQGRLECMQMVDPDHWLFWSWRD